MEGSSSRSLSLAFSDFVFGLRLDRTSRTLCLEGLLVVVVVEVLVVSVAWFEADAADREEERGRGTEEREGAGGVVAAADAEDRGVVLGWSEFRKKEKRLR